MSLQEKVKNAGRRWIYRREIGRYQRELAQFKTLLGNDRNTVPLLEHPRIADYGTQHPVPESVYEVSAASQMIAAVKPQWVHDVGSNLHYLAVLSSFIPVVSLDVREIVLAKKEFESKTGDARKMPFADGAIEFATSLCVMEHIGLGRYGDALDPQGDAKFAKELLRCLQPGGRLVISVPVGKEAICYNAHRIYSRTHLIELFAGSELLEEVYIGINGFVPYEELPLGNALTGLFQFKKFAA